MPADRRMTLPASTCCAPPARTDQVQAVTGGDTSTPNGSPDRSSGWSQSSHLITSQGARGLQGKPAGRTELRGCAWTRRSSCASLAALCTSARPRRTSTGTRRPRNAVCVPTYPLTEVINARERRYASRTEGCSYVYQPGRPTLVLTGADLQRHGDRVQRSVFV
jgi:hypothetical protein